MSSMEDIVKLINGLNIKTYTFDYSIYNQYIELWYDWYKGYDMQFHRAKHYNGIDSINYDKNGLNMASQVCRDHASLTCNENISLRIDGQAEKDYLLGHDEMSGLLGSNNFWSSLSSFYEIVCALGTGGYEVVVENLLSFKDRIIRGENSNIKLSYHNALEILPLSWDNNGKITEVCFVDRYKIKKDNYIDLRIHVLEDGQYVIINKHVKDLGMSLKIENLNSDVVDKFYTGSSRPWFSILKLPIVNNYNIKSPMGMSVYGNAINVLKIVDEAFNSLSKEYEHSLKKVFYHKSMLQRDDNTGEVITPDELKKTEFYFVGQEQMMVEGNTLPIKEYNPEIRIDELTSGLESALCYLSALCGLGNSYYKFTSSTGLKTATEVVSENSSMYRSIRKNELALEKFLLDLFRSILNVSNIILGTSFNVDVNMSVMFDASIVEDKNAVRERDLKEVELGIMSIEEFRNKWYDNISRRDTPEV